ncbi:ribbon-helix-helix domain-containing protein [Halocatena marina]|uniref:Ribbon-helix-helix domain-containing protein n=1 Tax=Halocatena marina TaxID=2934937 RepID=A0ABD5YZH2_9EURY|nr:ribbon-helix-helix domain-containing protein [Halocatena marina]
MAKADTDTENINIRLTAKLLEDLDDTWQDRGFNSRSEFIRQAIRDSVHQTQLSPAALQALLESSQQARRGEFVSSDEIREEFLNE